MSRLPLVPISLASADADPAAFAARFGAALERYGFAVVADHGLPTRAIDACLAGFRQFFALPDAEKRRWHVRGGAGARGYTPFGVETAKGMSHHDLKEFWHVGRELPPGHRYRRYMPDNVWIPQIPGLRAAALATYAAFDRLGARLLEAVARHLGLEPDWFVGPTRDGNSVLRVLHYPPLASPGAGTRAAAHEDINVLTLLLGADEAGLEVRDRDGSWRALQPPVGTLVCNVGDMLERLANHRLPSATHRVTNPVPERAAHARYALPFFLHFHPEFRIRTLPGCVDARRPDRYPQAITADAFLQQRLAEIGLR